MRVGAHVASAYRQSAGGPVAYIDESYSVDPRWSTFYTMVAVVVEADQRDIVRAELVRLAGSTWWHTTESLKTADGRQRTAALLHYLGDPNGTEVAVIAHRRQVEPNDVDGEHARAFCLTTILEHLANPNEDSEQVNLFVLERRRERRQANKDARTKADAVSAQQIPASIRLLQVTPGDEHLLWLPDLVCSAYRQHITGRGDALFGHVSHMCRILP